MNVDQPNHTADAVTTATARDQQAKRSRRAMRRRLPSPAMVVAVGALAVSVGGNVTAAALITGAGIKDNTIRSVDVRDGTLKSIDVTNGTLKGVDVANNALTGADIAESSLGQVPNAGKVDGVDANALTRVALTSTEETLALSLTPQTYGTPLSITAPAAGFVMIHGSTTVQNDGCTTACTVVARVRQIETGAQSTAAEETIPSGQRNANMAHTWVFPVSAGVNTFDVRLKRLQVGDGTLNGFFGELTAMYTPFGSTGTGTL
jgi:hypothetical protein